MKKRQTAAHTDTQTLSSGLGSQMEKAQCVYHSGLQRGRSYHMQINQEACTQLDQGGRVCVGNQYLSCEYLGQGEGGRWGGQFLHTLSTPAYRSGGNTLPSFHGSVVLDMPMPMSTAHIDSRLHSCRASSTPYSIPPDPIAS